MTMLGSYASQLQKIIMTFLWVHFIKGGMRWTVIVGPRPPYLDLLCNAPQWVMMEG